MEVSLDDFEEFALDRLKVRKRESSIVFCCWMCGVPLNCRPFLSDRTFHVRFLSLLDRSSRSWSS